MLNRTTSTSANTNVQDPSIQHTPVPSLVRLVGAGGGAGSGVAAGVTPVDGGVAEGETTTGAERDSNGSTGRLNLAAQLAQTQIDRYTPPTSSSPRRPLFCSSHPAFSGAASRGRRRCARALEEAEG